MKSKEFLKYRDVWMGVAILWIMFGHTTYSSDNVFLWVLHRSGYGGVDIFLFASGIGQYYSLAKNSNVGDYFQRRFIRLMPMYWCFMIPWIICKKLTIGLTNRAILGNIFCIQLFTGLGEEFNWYISFIWLCYFLAPFLKCWVDKLNSRIACIASVLLVILMSVPFWGAPVSTFMMTFCRLPVFFLGMCFAKIFGDREAVSASGILSFIVLMLLGFAVLGYCQLNCFGESWNNGMLWYPLIIIVPGLCMCISFAASKFKGAIGNGVCRFFALLGNHSLEIYLVHVLLVEYYRDYLIPIQNVPDRLLYWVVTYNATFAGAFLLYKATGVVLKIAGNLRRWKHE